MVFRKMALLGLAACAAAALVVAPMVSLQAAETAAAVAPTAVAPLVVTEPSWWQTLWAQVQAPLVTLLMAVLTAVGAMISTKVRQFLGARADQAFNATYQLAMDQAAGWLLNKLHASSTTTMTAGALNTAVSSGTTISTESVTAALDSAVEYATKSYPDIVDKLKVPPPDVGKDILAAFGKMVGVPPEIAKAVGKVVPRR